MHHDQNDRWICLALAAGLALGGALGSVGASDPDGAWLSQTQRRIEQAEYEITWQTRTVLPDLDAAWQAPNRAQGFRTYFTGTGIRVVPRAEGTPAWEWSLRLSRWGRPGAMRVPEIASLRRAANRVDYDRERLVEWYVNSPRGLEQGFTLATSPARKDDSSGAPEPAEVWIELALGGTLLPVVSADGEAIDFRTPGGAGVIHYAQLVVTDATGRALPSRMDGCDGGIRLVI